MKDHSRSVNYPAPHSAACVADVLNQQQITDYRVNGYLLLRGVFSEAEVAAMAVEAERLANLSDLVRPENLRTELWNHGRGRSERVSKFDPVTDVSSLFAMIASDPRITTVVEVLMGEAPFMFKDKLIYKQSGHPGFGAHQDIVWYWPFPTSIVTAMVSIDPATPANGVLEVAEGFQDMPNPVAKGELRNLSDGEVPPESAWRLLETAPGDIVLFGVMLPHRSGPNLGDGPRRVVHLSYSPASEGDLYQAHYEHRRNFLLRDNPPSQGEFLRSGILS